MFFGGHHRSVRRINGEYSSLLKDAKNRLLNERVRYSGRLGRVQTVHLNSGGLLIDVILDDGHVERNVDALAAEYDP